MRITDYVRQPGAYDTDEVSVETGLVCEDPSLAVQSEAEDADINTIVRRFGLTGTMPQGLKPPMYGDFTEVFDYRSALDAVMKAEDAFMAMPAEVRKRFDNDPQKFVEFASDPANLKEMRELGLAVPEKMPDAPIRVEVVEKTPPSA